MTDPGEPLLLSRSPLFDAVRFGSFVESTGLAYADVTMSRMIAIPLPVYPDAWPEGRKRWSGVKPAEMWHPLFWLPRRLSGRYTINEENGATSRETNDEWAARVSFELSMSRLYDTESGTWLDVLWTLGIDVDDELDQARIEDWLNGGSDEVLDGIDLTDLFDVEGDRDWALNVVFSLGRSLSGASWAIAAEDLMIFAGDVAAGRCADASDQEMAAIMSNIVFVAIAYFADIDADEAAHWKGLASLIETDPQLVAERAAEIAEGIVQRLDRIREQFWHATEELAEIGDIELEDVDAAPRHGA